MNQDAEIVPMNQDAEIVPMNQDAEIVPMNQNSEIVLLNQDDSLEVILSQNLVENDNDSFDDMVSQADEQEYRQNDSLDEFITQSDELRAERSANSKVNDWLATAKPKPTENLTIARREKVNENKENFPVVRKEKNTQNFAVKQSFNGPKKAEHKDLTGLLAEANSHAQQRSKYLFTLFSREQEFHQQHLDMIKYGMVNNDQK
jgi:hypothetical protein